jgi:hypothetical protein
MKIKSGVQILGLKPEILIALMVAEKIWSNHGQELVITSGTDGKHSENSRHYIGMAVDLRTRYFSESEKTIVTMDLQRELEGFKVILHKTHIHIQYNGVKNEI